MDEWTARPTAARSERAEHRDARGADPDRHVGPLGLDRRRRLGGRDGLRRQVDGHPSRDHRGTEELPPRE